MNRNDAEMKQILKNFSLYAGIALAVFSVYFSYDGLNNQVGDSNANYTTLTKVIGFSLALVVTLIQFIYHVDYDNLNKDMKIIGLGSYGYSIWTNILGIQHMFGFDPMTTYILAGVMDILPENMIAWGLGTTLDGGILDNIIKGITGRRGSGNRGNNQKPQNREPSFHQDQSNLRERNMADIFKVNVNQPKKGQGRKSLETQYRPSAKPSQTTPNRFHMDE